MIAARLDRALKAAGVPIVTVSVGREEDRSTWQIEFAKDVTDEQREAADALLRAFDPDATDVKALEDEDAARRFAESREMRAAFRANFRLVNRRDPTDIENAAAHAAFVQAFKDVGR